jgi:hypothetical protein
MGVNSSDREWLEQFFSFEHLKPELKDVSRPFCATAQWLIQNLERNPERTTALRKLLEAKDAAVRCKVASLAATACEPKA